MIMNLMDRIRKREKIVIPVTKISAGRVVYESQNLQKVEAKIEIENGAIVILELTPPQTEQLLQELYSSAKAINPYFKL